MIACTYATGWVGGIGGLNLGEHTVLVGSPGTGKSSLLIHALETVSTGGELFGEKFMPPHGQSVGLFFDFEGRQRHLVNTRGMPQSLDEIRVGGLSK